MPSSHYRFVTHWVVDARPEEVFRIIEDVSGFARWWPAVWLRVEERRPANAQGIGRVFDLTTKGLLPYVLRWRSESTVNEYPDRLELRATGDFVGRGAWHFEAEGPSTRVTYVWEIDTEKPLLRMFSPVLKPLFSANHAWAMRRGEQSLRLELARRHAANEEERARVPQPPRPVLFLSRNVPRGQAPQRGAGRRP